MAVDVNRGLMRDSRGNMLWDTRDEIVETEHGGFTQTVLVGQPNGGVIHRLGPGGMAVFMYCDDPGVFYNERGGKVSEAIAQQAGFDVQMLSKAQRRKQALLHAQTQVDEDFASQPSAHIIKERGEYRLVEIAAGHYQIQFIEANGTGTPLTNQPLTKAKAEKMFTDMAGEEPA